MFNKRGSVYPIEATFSRQQVQVKTGIADDVIAFWVKQSLLIPLPAIRRSHRRFGFYQLHVAAILNAMRSLGANIRVLRSFATMLQNGYLVWHASGLNPSQILSVETLRENLERFSEGNPVRIFTSADDFARSGTAGSEEEVIRSWLWSETHNRVDMQLVEFAKSISLETARSASWASALCDNSHLRFNSEAWIAWIDEAGTPRFAQDNEVVLTASDGPMAAFYIPVSRLIRRLWSDELGAQEPPADEEGEMSP